MTWITRMEIPIRLIRVIGVIRGQKYRNANQRNNEL